MRVSRFEWDEANEEHIAAHGVERAEAEQILRLGPLVRRGGGGPWLAWGKSTAGRHLLVVFVRTSGGGVRVVTARDMSRREKQRYRKAKK